MLNKGSVLDMAFLHALICDQKVESEPGVVPGALEPLDHLQLLGNVPLTQSDVPLSFRQVHLHDAKIHE